MMTSRQLYAALQAVNLALGEIIQSEEPHEYHLGNLAADYGACITNRQHIDAVLECIDQTKLFELLD